LSTKYHRQHEPLALDRLRDRLNGYHVGIIISSVCQYISWATPWFLLCGGSVEQSQGHRGQMAHTLGASG